MFAAQSGSVVTCAADTPETRDEKLVHKGFRDQFGEDVAKLNDQAKVLFKVTVDDGSKSKPIVYVGVAHTGRMSEVLDVFNQQYSGAAGQEGAFLLKAGYGVNPNKSAGNAFMQYGLELPEAVAVGFWVCESVHKELVVVVGALLLLLLAISFTRSLSLTASLHTEPPRSNPHSFPQGMPLASHSHAPPPRAAAPPSLYIMPHQLKDLSNHPVTNERRHPAACHPAQASTARKTLSSDSWSSRLLAQVSHVHVSHYPRPRARKLGVGLLAAGQGPREGPRRLRAPRLLRAAIHAQPAALHDEHRSRCPPPACLYESSPLASPLATPLA